MSSLRSFRRLALAGFLCWLVAVGVNLAVRQISPPEVLGWGERESLRPDQDLGWRLIESQQTRLKWHGYDYTVVSNSLGFPGPEYPVGRSPNTLRIMTVGGGFSSAEGVDTGLSWPRILEQLLDQGDPDMNVEVLNFSITGYGPDQYEAVVSRFAPIFRPDLIFVTLIPMDLLKATVPFEIRRQGIGFDLPKPDGIVSLLSCRHLLHLVTQRSRNLVHVIFRSTPIPDAYEYGQLWAFEKTQHDTLHESSRALESHFRKMSSNAAVVGSNLVVLLVPASVQVCSSRDLDYLSSGFSLENSPRFDPDQPQRAIGTAATRAGVPAFDLRLALGRDADPCPFQPNNLHWNADGHRRVAEFLATRTPVTLSSRDF